MSTPDDRALTALRLRLGIAGLGRAFVLMLPTLARHSRILLAGAADPRPEARDRFTREFSATAYATMEEMCADPTIDAVYIATPHRFHVEQAEIAARHGKHILVEKPMALTLTECDAMIAAAEKASVHLIVGHCHSFDAPYRLARQIIESGTYGPLRMIHGLNFTDFLYRPRMPEELRTSEGGGAVFSQAPHQIDIARMLADAPIRSVRAATGIWDPRRPTEGAFSAFITFENQVHASLTYSGYGHFDSDEFMGWRGEMGDARDPHQYGTGRRQLREMKTPQEEAALKMERAYGEKTRVSQASGTYNHFGFFLASCEHADLRPVADGVWIYADDEKHFERLPPPPTPRGEVIDELLEAVMSGVEPLHNGTWGRATLKACLAVLKSAREDREVIFAGAGEQT